MDLGQGLGFGIDVDNLILGFGHEFVIFARVKDLKLDNFGV